MTILLNFVPIALAIICYVLSAIFKDSPDAHSGLLVIAGALAGWAVPRLGDMMRRPDKATPASEDVTAKLGHGEK